MNKIGEREMEIGKMKKEATMNISIVVFVHLATRPVYTNFEDSDSFRKLEICDKMFIGVKTNEQTKGMISRRWLIF